MKRQLKKYLKQLGFKGRVRNHSSKQIWVIENTSSNGHPVAHILKPGMKSPDKIDADGFKRVDGKSIDGHKNWWKITDVSTADIFDWGQGLAIAVIYKTSVHENHFGKPIYKKKCKMGRPHKLHS